VSDFALDSSLLVAPRDGDRFRCEVVVTSQLKDTGVEADQIALALEHDTFQVVVQRRAWRPLESLKGLDVTAEEAVERLVEREARESAA